MTEESEHTAGRYGTARVCRRGRVLTALPVIHSPASLPAFAVAGCARQHTAAASTAQAGRPAVVFASFYAVQLPRKFVFMPLSASFHFWEARTYGAARVGTLSRTDSLPFLSVRRCSLLL